MADLTSTDRLQPVLLDRLLDDEPGKQLESRDKRVMSMSAIRQSILRDLDYLLNAPARPLGDEIYRYPLASHSVLNFGTRPFAGKTSSDSSREGMRASVERAISDFEPRLLPGSVRVRRVENRTFGNAGFVSMVLELAGEVHPLPMPDSLFVRTEVDLEMNRWQFTSSAAPSPGSSPDGGKPQ